jgi:aspartate-semialdehyde dehydrogenase
VAYRVTVVGATGAVGREMVKILGERRFPVAELRLLASARSVGTEIEFRGEKIKVEELNEKTIKGSDLYLFSAGATVSRQYAPIAALSGIVIDNSSAFRMEPDVPLVVPEVNAEDALNHRGIIANPNCSTIQMVVALYPLHLKFRIKRIIVATYQSVSGTGQKAINELENQVRGWVNKEEVKPEVYPYPIAFNLIPRIDVFLDNLYTKEEMKMVAETRKIMHASDILVSATCVRVPVFRCHSEAVTVEFATAATIEEVKSILAVAPGVVLMDDPSNDIYPTPRELAYMDEVYVGRIRESLVFENGVSMWIVADNLRKGAALNAVQIAEYLHDKQAI